MGSWCEKLKNWVKRLKRDLNALRIALIEDLVPWYVKILIIITVGYALSPIDLIPDFIPILGLLDDLLIVPFLIYLAIKLIPEETMEHCRQQAATRELPKKKSWIVGGIIIALWIALAAWAAVDFLG